MKVTCYTLEEYHQLEQDLCAMHSASEEEDILDREYVDIKTKFSSAYPNATIDDYEFPEWHNNMRMMWLYLYSDIFYTNDFIRNIQRILNSMSKSWFAQFECYSPSAVTSESPNGSLGHFMIYKNSVMIWECDSTPILIEKIEAQSGPRE
jgi:hypothetical protein